MIGTRLRQRGFTIVELLIVIVVIAILASISVVAYNGVQQRALNSRVQAGANAYYKAVMNYKTTTGIYPTNSGCLGASYPGGACWQGVSGNFSVNAALDNALAEFMPTKPTLATSLFSIGIGDNMRAGLLYQYQTPTTSRMVFYLQGINQPCGVTGFTGANEGGVVTQCTATLTN